MPKVYYLFHHKADGYEEFALYEDSLEADYACLDKPEAEVISLMLIEATPWMLSRHVQVAGLSQR